MSTSGKSGFDNVRVAKHIAADLTGLWETTPLELYNASLRVIEACKSGASFEELDEIGRSSGMPHFSTQLLSLEVIELARKGNNSTGNLNGNRYRLTKKYRNYGQIHGTYNAPLAKKYSKAAYDRIGELNHLIWENGWLLDNRSAYHTYKTQLKSRYCRLSLAGRCA